MLTSRLVLFAIRPISHTYISYYVPAALTWNVSSVSKSYLTNAIMRPRRRQTSPEGDATAATGAPAAAATSAPAATAVSPPSISSTTYANLRRGRHPRSLTWAAYLDFFGVFIVIGLIVLIAMLIWEVVIPTHKQRVYYGVLGVSLLPVGLAAYCAVRPHRELHQRVTPLVVVVSIVCGIFPAWVNAGVVGVALFLFGWVTRPIVEDVTTCSSSSDGGAILKSKSSEDESGEDDKETKPLLAATNAQKVASASTLSKQMQYNLGKTTACAILLTIVMLSENFFIWVVSATFEPGWDPRTAPEPLQDNGRRVLQSFFKSLDFTKRDVVSMRRVWNVQYALVAALGTALCTFDFHPTRQLWSMGCRALLTLASARFLRTISFLLTVLPSQNKFCYGQHFPNPPPDNWSEWLLEGLNPNNSGGCNDLIVSGHATVTTTAACVAVGMAEDPLFSLAVSLLLALDFAVEIFEGFHYSVDMWMGAVLVGLLWRVWKPFEDNNKDRNAATLHDMAQRFWQDKLTLRDAIFYGGPVLVAYLQVTVLPAVLAIPISVCMIAGCAIQIVRRGFQQYHKHIFFSSLFLLLGVFL